MIIIRKKSKNPGRNTESNPWILEGIREKILLVIREKFWEKSWTNAGKGFREKSWSNSEKNNPDEIREIFHGELPRGISYETLEEISEGMLWIIFEIILTMEELL